MAFSKNKNQLNFLDKLAFSVKSLDISTNLNVAVITTTELVSPTQELTKSSILIRDLFSIYHPDFIKDPLLCQAMMKYPRLLDAKLAAEEAIAFVGKLSHEPVNGRDFGDKSDCKTATVSQIESTGYYRLTVKNTENKVGCLRIIAVNLFKNNSKGAPGSIDYFVIPNEFVRERETNDAGKTSKSKKIQVSWTQLKDDYNSWETYRFETFEEMAKFKV